MSESQNSLLRLCGRQKGSHAWAWYMCRFFEKQRSERKKISGVKWSNEWFWVTFLSAALYRRACDSGISWWTLDVAWIIKSLLTCGFRSDKKRRKQLTLLNCANQCGADNKPVKSCSSLIRCKINSRWFIVAYCDDKKFPCEALRHWVTFRNFHLR